MSITIEIDEALWRSAEEATEMHDLAALVKHLLEKEIRLRQAGRRLAAAGGSMPDLELPPRQRPGTELR